MDIFTPQYSGIDQALSREQNFFFIKPEMARQSNIGPFARLSATDTLVRMSERDLWAVEPTIDGKYVIKRLFDDSEGPIQIGTTKTAGLNSEKYYVIATGLHGGVVAKRGPFDFAIASDKLDILKKVWGASSIIQVPGSQIDLNKYGLGATGDPVSTPGASKLHRLTSMVAMTSSRLLVQRSASVTSQIYDYHGNPYRVV